jgi:hypothetical protein
MRSMQISPDRVLCFDQPKGCLDVPHIIPRTCMRVHETRALKLSLPPSLPSQPIPLLTHACLALARENIQVNSFASGRQMISLKQNTNGGRNRSGHAYASDRLLLPFQSSGLSSAQTLNPRNPEAPDAKP